MSARSRLELSRIRFGYLEGPDVVDGVNLALAPGEIVALAGPNGSGKSTLLKIAASLLRPRSGRLEWDGRDAFSLSRSLRARELAFLPQRVRPLYSFSAEEVVEMGRYPHRPDLGARLDADDRRTVEQAMRRCEVETFAARRFDTLSGGERQRVLLAAALAQTAGILVLDEPTTALDIHHQVRFLETLATLSDEGSTILYATHDLNLAACFADRIVLLSRGRAVADGAPETILQAGRLREVFGEGLRVGSHPEGTPWVLPVPRRTGGSR